jgi:hypothetical protein
MAAGVLSSVQPLRQEASNSSAWRRSDGPHEGSCGFLWVSLLLTTIFHGGAAAFRLASPAPHTDLQLRPSFKSGSGSSSAVARAASARSRRCLVCATGQDNAVGNVGPIIDPLVFIEFVAESVVRPSPLQRQTGSKVANRSVRETGKLSQYRLARAHGGAITWPVAGSGPSSGGSRERARERENSGLSEHGGRSLKNDPSMAARAMTPRRPGGYVGRSHTDAAESKIPCTARRESDGLARRHRSSAVVRGSKILMR